MRKRAVQGGILVKARNGRVPVDERILKIAKRPTGLISGDEAFFVIFLRPSKSDS